MKHAAELTDDQKQTLVAVGLDPEDWLCRLEGKRYLHLIQKSRLPAELRIIDKEQKKVLAPTKANQDIRN
jgi:hypothetical protein